MTLKSVTICLTNFICVIFARSYKENNLAYNLNKVDYVNIINHLKYDYNIEIILSISSSLPYNKTEACELISNSDIDRYRMVDIWAIDTKNGSCSIDHFTLQISDNSRVINATRLENVGCDHKPLFGREFQLICNFISSHLDSLIETPYYKYFCALKGNSTCSNMEVFTFMPSSPLYTKRWGVQRRSWVRLNRKIGPSISNPSEFQFLIDHSSYDSKSWKIVKIWYRNQSFEFDKFSKKNFFMHNLSIWPYPLDQRQERKLPCHSRNADRLLTLESNGAIKYGKWSLFCLYSETVGIRLLDVRFQDVSIAFEISLAEIVTSYSGFSPFIQAMTSIESMYGIGNFMSELSPSVDCPENAQYISLDKLVRDTKQIHKIKRAVCVFTKKSTKPLRRHYEFKEAGPQMKFASAVPGYLLHVRFIISLFNYDYIFDNIFHDSGVIDIVVTPTGYIHVDSYNHINFTKNPQLTKFGFSNPSLNLLFPLHQHLFFFKLDLDVIEKENNFHVIDIAANNSKAMGQNMWLEERIVKWENESVMKHNFSTPKLFLICYDNTTSSRCLQIINKSPIPDLIPNEFLNSINWKRFQLAVTKRRDNESHGSSIFNGVNLVESKLNFETFLSNNDYLENEDLVIWSAIGSLHIPTIEDIPNTITSSNEMKLTIKPFNLFEEAPQGRSNEELFTRKIDDWKRGFRCKDKKN